jgi:hypothetical protein
LPIFPPPFSILSYVIYYIPKWAYAKIRIKCKNNAAGNSLFFEISLNLIC